MARWGENTRAIMLYAREDLFAANVNWEWALSPGDRELAMLRVDYTTTGMFLAENMFSR